MSTLKLYEIPESHIPIEGEIGALYFTTDTFELYKTMSDLSIQKYTDIIILSTEQQRLDLLVPLSEKFYYIKETKIMWFYDGIEWKRIIPDMSVYLRNDQNNTSIQSQEYKSSDGSIGITTTFTSQDGKTITVKNGLITNIQ